MSKLTDTPAIIQNFTIDAANISGAEGKAIVVSRYIGTPKDVTKNSQIINVTVSNSTASFTGNNSGIIAGRGENLSDAITISGCKVTNTDLICTLNSTTNATRYGLQFYYLPNSLYFLFFLHKMHNFPVPFLTAPTPSLLLILPESPPSQAPKY